VDIINGKGAKEVSPAIYEVMFAYTFNWDLEKIRNLSYKDFRLLAPMVDVLFRKKLESGLG
jgi:hypothetical protein